MNEEARKRADDYYAGTMKDDYISRKAVLDMLDEECGSCADTVYIFSLPGIEKRKTGKWKVVDAEEPRRYGCSQCKCLSFYAHIFCPCCGARMEGIDETD